MRHNIIGHGKFDEVKTHGSNRSFVWSDEKGKSSLVIKYDAVSDTILEVNTFGLNLRQGLIESWIETKKSIYFMLQHLADAVFDPEFFRIYEPQILGKFNRQNGTELKQQRTWSRLLRILSM